MKPSARRQSCTAAFALPRFANRGLIEARLARALLRASLAHFPDSRIGASLKRRTRIVERLAEETSPIRESGPH